MISYYSSLFLMNTFLYFRYENRMFYFLFFLNQSKSRNIETEYKYGQYCTLLSQSDCRYFFVLAIIFIIDVTMHLIHNIVQRTVGETSELYAVFGTVFSVWGTA